MAPTVPTARIGDLGKEGKKAPSDGRFHATPPCNTSPETGLSLRQVLLLFSQVQTVKSPGEIRLHPRQPAHHNTGVIGPARSTGSAPRTRSRVIDGMT